MRLPDLAAEGKEHHLSARFVGKGTAIPSSSRSANIFWANRPRTSKTADREFNLDGTAVRRQISQTTLVPTMNPRRPA
jgi:hypothetical protein